MPECVERHRREIEVWALYAQQLSMWSKTMRQDIKVVK
jgi:hypothetical protein